LAWKSPFSAKLPDISHPQFSLSLPEVSRVFEDVGVVAVQVGTSKAGFVYGCGTSGGLNLRGPTEEEEEDGLTYMHVFPGLNLGPDSCYFLSDFLPACPDSFQASAGLNQKTGGEIGTVDLTSDPKRLYSYLLI
jgi:hypothetical protein